MKFKTWIYILSGVLLLLSLLMAVQFLQSRKPEAVMNIIEAPQQNEAFQPQWTLPKKKLLAYLGENLALHKPVAYGDKSFEAASPANDGSTDTCWEGREGSVPERLTVDLEKVTTIKRVRVRLEPSDEWIERIQKIAVAHSRDGKEFVTVINGLEYTFSPATGNFIEIDLNSVDTRYVRLEFLGNNVSNRGQAAEFEVYGPNLAFRKWITTNAYEDVYHERNAVDGNFRTYWEGKANSWPNILTLDLDKPTEIQSIIIRLPPYNVWEMREQTFTVETSMDGEKFEILIPEEVYEFDPLSGNIVEIKLDKTNTRYLRFKFTRNTAASGGQAAEIEVY